MATHPGASGGLHRIAEMRATELLQIPRAVFSDAGKEAGFGSNQSREGREIAPICLHNSMIDRNLFPSSQAVEASRIGMESPSRAALFGEFEVSLPP
jgi:hypothetical protein